jgi:hypothetical protein
LALAWLRLAAQSAVMVSQTVKDLVAGSGLTFEDSGEHELKAVWHCCTGTSPFPLRCDIWGDTGREA